MKVQTRWGICCAGRVANEFTLALKSLPLIHHKVRHLFLNAILD